MQYRFTNATWFPGRGALIGCGTYHVSVLAVVQLPRLTGKGDGRDGASRRRDGASATERSKPDHDFVLGVTRRGAGSEEIIRHVGDDVGSGVGPGPKRSRVSAKKAACFQNKEEGIWEG